MIAYITGASSGIGKALSEFLLERNHDVIGLSRRQTIQHPNYRHIAIDLSNIDEIKTFSFPANFEDDIILVNNAGTIGPIKPIGHQVTEEIIDLNNLNILAPQALCNKFIHQYQGNRVPNYRILNISSGAGKRPIDAWATYCASKAAIDLFSETIAEELQTRNHKNWHIYSIAPGVVDTEMQATIRQSNPKDFQAHQNFVDLKNNDELIDSREVAKKLGVVLTSEKGTFPTVFSLKNMS